MMGLDTYFFNATDITVWQSAIIAATMNSHLTFVEEFAPQRWVQAGIFPADASEIKGALSCDWRPPFNHHIENFLAAFLPWIASTGASSASLFDPEILSQCASVYPDNSNTVIRNWNCNSLWGATLSRGSLH